jgi:hypothetical protein
MPAMSEYKNLTKDELELADHYFETGNFAELAKFQVLSAKRGGDVNHNPDESTILSTHTIKNQ